MGWCNDYRLFRATDRSGSLTARRACRSKPTWVETADKIALIDQLSLAGFSRIEAGSFVSPKAVPALRDGDEVFRGIQRHPGVIYVALIPNLKGAQRAIDAGADELNLVMSASQTHNLRKHAHAPRAIAQCVR
jgi:hydroxymethylglutaryl-CoA lyase